MDDEKLRLMVGEAARAAVKAELDERQHIPPLEHYLQHQWVKEEMKQGRSLKQVIIETAARWGTVAAIVTFIYGLLYIFKIKLGGLS